MDIRGVAPKAGVPPRRSTVGPDEDGRSAYQGSLTVCSVCRSPQQLGGGKLVPVGDAIVAMAEFDAQNLGPISSMVANENVCQSLAIRTPDAVAQASACAPSSPVSADAAIASSLTRTASAWPDARSAKSSNHAHVGAPPENTSPSRAKQTIPPALRSAVLATDQHRCRVRDASRTAHIEHDSFGNVVFRHADGTPYGQAAAPGAVYAHAKVFAALRHLRFRERECKAVLAELLADDELREATTERLLREALCRIRAVAR